AARAAGSDSRTWRPTGCMRARCATAEARPPGRKGRAALRPWSPRRGEAGRSCRAVTREAGARGDGVEHQEEDTDGGPEVGRWHDGEHRGTDGQPWPHPPTDAGGEHEADAAQQHEQITEVRCVVTPYCAEN